MKKIIHYRNQRILLGQRLIVNDLVIPEITEKFIQANLSLFTIEKIKYPVSLKHYIKSLDPSWSAIEPRFYWLKIFSLIADTLNDVFSKEEARFFVTKEEDLVKCITNPYRIFYHLQVRYNLIYFNSETTAKEAIKIMGDRIRYVV